MNATAVRWVTGVSLVMFGVGCGSDEGDNEAKGFEISQSALSGTIAGEPFEVMSGFAADIFGDGELWVELHSTQVEDPCSRLFPDGPHIILSVAPAPADAALGVQNNITFTYGDAQNDVATMGRLVIDGVVDGRLSGGLYATMREHEVDGTFDVPVCAD